jgi:amino acid transporter
VSKIKSVKRVFLGKGRDPLDPTVFHKISLIAFFAWVGLGSDGLSSSCYGPGEVLVTLGSHVHLSLLIGLGTVITIFVISASYSQIIELFPSGGGGYLVASKLLSPYVGMVSGSALLIDYVLTITVSIASGADALFSFFPKEYHQYKLLFALVILIIITLMNIRGVKESVLPLVPIFLIFVFTHAFIIVYNIIIHAFDFPVIVAQSSNDFQSTFTQLGFYGTLFLLIHAFSMGAGTFTGIEAVSNGIPILKEPKVHTAKVTMRYMAISLSVTAFGLFLSYILLKVVPVPGKTANATLFVLSTSGWNPVLSNVFVIVTLISEAAILFVAAQTGFLDGPRVLANMAHDRWVPSSFASLSDRLVTQKGILLMSAAAFVLMIFSHGSVTFLLVLYSINVFLTFCLSQIGMVKHWWQMRKEEKYWKKKLLINGIGLFICMFILFGVIITKFGEGGWFTLVVTGTVVLAALYIKNHYKKAGQLMKKLDSLCEIELDTLNAELSKEKKIEPQYDRGARTAVLLVNGFSGIGIHSLLSIFRLFGTTFKNFAFVQVGVIDAGVFKGAQEIKQLQDKIRIDVDKYIDFMKRNGYYAEAFVSTGLDVEEEIMKQVPNIKKRFPKSVFFGGQIVFPNDTFITRLLHNYTVFSVQRKLYADGTEFVILPIKLIRPAA